MQIIQRRGEKNKRRLGKKSFDNVELWMLLLPTLLYFLIFKYIPMFGASMAFQDYSISKGIFGSEFVGFDNFKEFLTNYKFFELLRNTLVISGMSLLLGFPLPIILALLLNELRNKRFKKSIQTITYLPYFISTVVAVGIIKSFVSYDGVINAVRGMMDLPAIQFMTTPKYFPWIYVISGIWQGLGWSSIIYVAAISGVDQELYEAAEIDGAGRFGKVIYITLPCIASTIVVLLIMQIGQMLTVGYEKIILLYNPTLYETADVISTYVYRKGLLEADYGYSTAVSMFNSVCNFILLLSANGISRKINGEGLW